MVVKYLGGDEFQVTGEIDVVGAHTQLPLPR